MQNLNYRQIPAMDAPPLKIELTRLYGNGIATQPVSPLQPCLIDHSKLNALSCAACRQTVKPAQKNYLVVTGSKPRNLSALRRALWILLLALTVGGFILGDAVLNGNREFTVNSRGERVRE